MQNDKITLTYPARPPYIASIRLAASGLAGACGCEVDKIEDIKTCLGEACLLLVCSQKCSFFHIEVTTGPVFRFCVKGLEAQAIGPCRHCMSFNAEMSRTIIEALSQNAVFTRENGLLTQIGFEV